MDWWNQLIPQVHVLSTMNVKSLWRSGFCTDAYERKCLLLFLANLTRLDEEAGHRLRVCRQKRFSKTYIIQLWVPSRCRETQNKAGELSYGFLDSWNCLSKGTQIKKFRKKKKWHVIEEEKYGLEIRYPFNSKRRKKSLEILFTASKTSFISCYLD